MTAADPVRDAFLGAATVVRPLLADHDTAQRWQEPSVLPELAIGALAAHTARAVIVVGQYLDGTPPEPGIALATAPDYYVQVGVTDTLDDAANVAVRKRAARLAGDGPHELLRHFDHACGALATRLAQEPPDRSLRVAADIPMLLDEYLVTRILELVVHADDLGCSLGVETAAFSPVALACTIGCLLEIARLRHGDLAVIRAMTRRERDATAALRVL